jgi:hypothetical protein
METRDEPFGASLPSTRLKKLSVRPTSRVFPAFLSANGLAAGAAADLAAAARLAKGFRAVRGERSVRRERNEGTEARKRTLLWRWRRNVLLLLLQRLITLHPPPLRRRRQLLVSLVHDLIVLLHRLDLNIIALRSLRLLKETLPLLRRRSTCYARRRTGRNELAATSEGGRAGRTRGEHVGGRRGEEVSGGALTAPVDAADGCGGDIAIVGEVRPLARPLRGRSVRIGLLLLRLLDELDTLSESGQVEEAGDLDGGVEGSGLGEEDNSVESGFEAVGFAERLNDLEKVLVGGKLFASEGRFEGVVVGRGTILAVRDEKRLADVPTEENSERNRGVKGRRRTYFSSS